MDNLNNMPAELREEVEKYLRHHEGAKILTTRITKSTPYKDKSVVTTTYRVFVEFYENLLVVFRVWDSGKYGMQNVYSDSMTADDIDVFLKHSSWFEGRDRSE